MLKNTANQKWIVFAFDATTGLAQTGDAAQITANLRKDYGDAAAITDTNPTELEDGFYAFDLSQAETNADHLVICPVSSTSNIVVIGCPAVIFTEPTGRKYPASLAAADVSGNVPVDVSAIQSGLATGTNVSDAQTAIISAVNAATPDIDFPTAVEIRQEMDGNSTQLAAILEDTGTTIPGLINADSGAGAISHSYTLTDADDGTPIDGAEVWVTTDAAGVDVVASGSTNSFGVVTFMLDAGAYYFWRKCSGYNFNNPDLETVS